VCISCVAAAQVVQDLARGLAINPGGGQHPAATIALGGWVGGSVGIFRAKSPLTMLGHERECCARQHNQAGCQMLCPPGTAMQRSDETKVPPPGEERTHGCAKQFSSSLKV
jgi:hypothetical protein